MTKVDRGLLFENELTEDTTSSGLGRNRVFRMPGGRSAWERPDLRGHEDLRALSVVMHVWGPAYLGAAHERAATLCRWDEVSTDVTSWELHDEALRGLAGVVAVPRHRRVLFQMTLDISPGSLPRRTPRFAFLDTRELPDDE